MTWVVSPADSVKESDTPQLSEDHGSYDHADPDEPAGGVKPIGEILRQVIDERGWPLSAVSPRPNGGSPGDAGGRDD